MCSVKILIRMRELIWIFAGRTSEGTFSEAFVGEREGGGRELKDRRRGPWNNSAFSLVPQNQNRAFSMAHVPLNYLCWPVPFNNRLLLPCSPEIKEALPRGYLFPCCPEKNRHFPLFPQIKILIFYVPCSPKLHLFTWSRQFYTFVPLFPWNKWPYSPVP